MKKIDGYPHNGYPTDMGTGTGQIFIQRVGYGGATTRTLPAPLTSLVATNVGLWNPSDSNITFRVFQILTMQGTNLTGKV